MPDKDKSVKIDLHIMYKDGTSVTVGLSDLLKALGKDEPASTVGLAVTQDHRSLLAAVSPDDSDYPSVTVDGIDERNKPLYLMQAELPNADNPDAITARLYAGCADYETDGPIALVRHKVTDPDFTKDHKDRVAAGRTMTKIVYVDTETAQYRPWNGGEELPEHAED